MESRAILKRLAGDFLLFIMSNRHYPAAIAKRMNNNPAKGKKYI